jgi:branched-chain amino acid transport system permease protein
MRWLTTTIAAHPIAAFVVVFTIFPFVIPYEALAAQVLTYGLFALGFNIIYGYTGLLSFGHAAFWGLGAYGTGITLAKLGVTSLWAGLAVGIGAALVAGVVVGYLCLRRRGIYFAMLTLAFGQMIFFSGFHLSDWTGGDDGLRGIPRLPVEFPGISIPLDSPLGLYFFIMIVVTLMLVGLKRILESPFGAVLQAIRENQSRAEACGYDVRRVKLLSFTLSALFAGVAGALEAIRLNFVPIDALYWTTSAQVVIMTLLGGAGTFFGPFIGAGVFLLLEDRLSLVMESWPLVMGLIFIAFVLFLPKGIWGTLLEHLHRSDRPTEAGAESLPAPGVTATAEQKRPA